MVLVSCSKVERTQKKLVGEWSIIGFKYTNASGITYNYDASGVGDFNNCDSPPCAYSFDMNYTNNQGTSVNFNQGGNYAFVEDNGEYLDLYRTYGGTSDTLKNARIILITKDDLLFEFGDLNGRYIFTMAKP